MKFHIITLFPEIFEGFFKNGVIYQAYKKALYSYNFYNPRDYVQKHYKSVDDSPYGGGDGMVMAYEPLKRALFSIQNYSENPENFHVIFLSPQGRIWQDSEAKKKANDRSDKELVLICGRYAGIDQRFLYRYVDEEISIGDYVVSGGEVPAMVLMDSILRQIPGVLGNIDSAKNDSFLDDLLEAPIYTKPESVEKMSVPDVLISGHHGRINEWRRALSLILTAQRRPDLVAKKHLALEDIELSKKIWQNLSEKEKEELGLGKNYPF